jgi:hypothetical protein
MENHAMGHKFDVSKSYIRNWRKKQDLLLQKSGSKRAFYGQKAKFPEIEEKLRDYINDKRQFGCAVSAKMCQLKALALAKDMEIKSSRPAMVGL